MRQSHDRGRRGFLRQGAALGLAAWSAPWAMNLSAMAEAAAAQAGATDDYKALVCIFLNGGNDQGNTVVPTDDASHALYARLRGPLALTQDDLRNTALQTQVAPPAGTPSLALAPNLDKLAPLFNAQRRLAVLLNIGPLHAPTTKAQFQQGSAELPPKLFSHNDQQSVWQSYGAEGSTQGWGGLIGDAALAHGQNALPSLTCVNLAGNAVFQAGAQAAQFMVNPRGPVAVQALDAAKLFGSQACVDAFRSLVSTEAPSVHRLAKEHSAIMQRAIATNGTLIEQLAQVTVPPVRLGDPTQDGHNPLADQLNTAARIMAAHQALGAGGVKRQVFFVSLGGFDTHDNFQVRHPKLMRQLGDAMAQLDADLQDMGMLDQVTTFTASEFGRTLTSNGDGSDHGWGSHHFVMGGAVKGGRLYGTWPELTDFDAGAHNIGQGRLLPTLSVDHLAAALAAWMGVTDAHALQQIAPHFTAFTEASPLAGLF